MIQVFFGVDVRNSISLLKDRDLVFEYAMRAYPERFLSKPIANFKVVPQRLLFAKLAGFCWFTVVVSTLGKKPLSKDLRERIPDGQRKYVVLNSLWEGSHLLFFGQGGGRQTMASQQLKTGSDLPL